MFTVQLVKIRVSSVTDLSIVTVVPFNKIKVLPALTVTFFGPAGAGAGGIFAKGLGLAGVVGVVILGRENDAIRS